MTKLIRIAAVMGIGVAMMPFVAIAQAPAEHTAAASAPTITVEDQATREQVERLFEVMHVRKQAETMLNQMSTMVQQQMSTAMKKEVDESTSDKKITPEQLAARQQILSRFMDRAIHGYSVDELLGTLTPIYQRHISRSDVEALIAFYGSSAGQHLLEQQPLIMQEYLAQITNTMQEKIATITDQLKKELEEQSAKENPEGSTQK